MSLQSYVSHADQWEQRATIRSRPRRIVEDDDLSYYPVERQPLYAHPAVIDAGKQVQDYILLQSFYKYINDVIIFETEIVNRTALAIAKSRFPFEFPFACRSDAMSVVIDENYHAYVAMDYLDQVERSTGIGPIEQNREIELSRAIPRAMEYVPPQYAAGMELLGVAISENTVTAEVAAFSRDTTLKRSVKGVMADHLADEGRHSVFWINLVKLYWREIDEPARVELGRGLPFFLREYLTNELQLEFDRRLIATLDLPAATREQIARDMVGAYPITNQHPMIVNIRKFLKMAGLLEHEPTRAAIAQYL
ncbi:diiron oxygenase [Pandoraea apista]|uniref:Aminobenzoate oxygenase n=1 Tax=Pandoraea apista TaxID=93218 RepID=A0A5E5PDS1_9BURK|nr:diiron oxygenase [Pandoraea apista]AJF00503.1 aminobenzoate oxygenase [Pandoraea apista]AKH74691.1 aminobenzoate oxygenase [Pandoraea apista]AKI61780.1 aminobenzoate oxygenase [Pandoraea apista]AVF40039.1 aminobenzoate oxygenase [Pandoraea apista]OXS93178.1 aminobenzoate oxygenase [Pandoraea apista]